jgi:hypothetical protein
MSAVCKRLHELVQRLPETRWPFDLNDLPLNGIYFFYETGEYWGHGDDWPRIVRVGTHREGNFRSRIADHYVMDERKMAFSCDQPAPKDRSIFRKNIGRVLLHRDLDPYESIWNIEFTTRASRDTNAHRRDIEKEMQLETQVTRILRERFAFRCVELEGEERRMGAQGLEAALIGTLARCGECCASPVWLGRSSPKPKIVQSSLWLEHHIRANGLTENSIAQLEHLVGRRQPE